MAELKKQNIWNKTEETTFADIYLFCFFLFNNKKNQGFIEEDNPPEEVVIAEEEDGIDVDDTRNLEDSPRLTFVNEECGNL